MIFYSKWLALSLATRAEIARILGIAKTGPTHVVDNRIQSDGYKIEDVERALNVEAIKAHLGVEGTDLNLLLDLLVDKIEGRAPVAPVEDVEKLPDVVNSPVVEEPKDVKPKKVTKKKK